MSCLEQKSHKLLYKELCLYTNSYPDSGFDRISAAIQVQALGSAILPPTINPIK